MNKRYEKPLTPKELAARPDSEIDYSDIPELDDRFWDNAKITPPRTFGLDDNTEKVAPDQSWTINT